MKYLIVLLVLVQVCYIYGQDEPAIVKISRNQQRNIGDSTEFKCTVANADNYPVVWLKEKGSNKKPQQLSNGATVTVQDDRYNLVFDKARSSYNFKIDDLQPRDAGVYRCEVRVSDTDVLSAEVSLSLSADGSAF